MNELQNVAEGERPRKPSLLPKIITGAIADSVNYTVEELRQLVTMCRIRRPG
jgi:twitching motility protein PilJ